MVRRVAALAIDHSSDNSINVDESIHWPDRPVRAIFIAGASVACERLAVTTKETKMLKTLSFAAVHFTVAFTIGYLLTGSVLVGGTLALVEPACNTIAYHLHE